MGRGSVHSPTADSAVAGFLVSLKQKNQETSIHVLPSTWYSSPSACISPLPFRWVLGVQWECEELKKQHTERPSSLYAEELSRSLQLSLSLNFKPYSGIHRKQIM